MSNEGIFADNTFKKNNSNENNYPYKSCYIFYSFLPDDGSRDGYTTSYHTNKLL